MSIDSILYEVISPEWKQEGDKILKVTSGPVSFIDKVVKGNMQRFDLDLDGDGSPDKIECLFTVSVVDEATGELVLVGQTPTTVTVKDDLYLENVQDEQVEIPEFMSGILTNGIFSALRKEKTLTAMLMF